MRFYRVHIELTNICGLKCTFCPPKLAPSKTMTLEFFEKVLKELQPFTKEVTFHVMGDPLTLSNLQSYLDVTHAYGFRVMLTTSGYYLDKHSPEVLLHPCVKQLNISLNSFNKNNTALTQTAYFESIKKLCLYKLSHKPETFINLRLWNLDEQSSDAMFNEAVYGYFEEVFETKVERLVLEEQRPKSYRLASRILLHFDEYFEWPNMQSQHHSHGTCQGLQSHFGILADGRVVPCCLDAEGAITLGDLHVNTLESILSNEKTQAMIQGFKERKAVEALCQKCTYKHRFDATQEKGCLAPPIIK